MFLNVFQELAGLGGDVFYLKNEIQYQKAFELPLSLGLTTSFRTGLLYPFSSSQNSIGNANWGSRINDRFHLGGPTSLRGFEAFGLGPKDKRNPENLMSR
jgi:outer membrane protein insertion porin family